MSFLDGEFFRLDTRNGIFQVLSIYCSNDEGNQYYFRKVFDSKFNLKITKADIVHESWMRPLSAKMQKELALILADDSIMEKLNDHTIERSIQFGTKGVERVEIFWCSMNPKNKKRLERQINSTINGFINPYLLRESIRELHNKGELHIECCCSNTPSEGDRLYRIELGKYCDDYDEFGVERFREMRFYEIKI